MIRTALSIAGSDSGGGAGVQADLKTFLAHGVYGMTAITAITAQNTLGVDRVDALPPEAVSAQIRSVRADLPVHAVKIGMLGTRAIVEAVADALDGFAGPVVLDPVCVSTSGHALIDDDALDALRALARRVTLVTPNLPEYARLGGAAWLAGVGVPVLVKGGHADGPVVTDRLHWPGGAVAQWEHPRVASRNTHGTGCTLSSAIAARLATGASLEGAVAGALDWLAGLVAGSAGHTLGGGHGPLLHGLLEADR
jgi:hydroxymethylpyrimidine/phosphomethylpyrimidine kinase